MANSDLIGSLVRGIEILKLVGNAENGLKVSDVAAALKLKSPTCYNFIRTLVACGFLQKRGNSLYLGEEFVQLAKKHQDNSTLVLAEMELLALYQRLPRCTVVLATPSSQGILQNYRITFERPGVIQRLDSELMHLYASATGLVFLAFTTDESTLVQVNERWPFAEFGAHLWSTRVQLNNYLDNVRQSKIAVSPFDQDVSYRISAPVLNRSNKLIAAIGVSIPIIQNREIDKKLVTNELIISAKRIADILQ